MKQLQKRRIMKTLIETLTVTLAIYGALFILVAGIAFGTEINTKPPITFKYPVAEVEEEAYIDDIPFDTREIADNYTAELPEEIIFEFEAETYVDDIPFDTEAIAANYRYEKALDAGIDFEDEAYVDDIPFNTFKIALEYEENLAMNK